jgi:hypothetical protein
VLKCLQEPITQRSTRIKAQSYCASAPPHLALAAASAEKQHAKRVPQECNGARVEKAKLQRRDDGHNEVVVLLRAEVGVVKRRVELHRVAAVVGGGVHNGCSSRLVTAWGRRRRRRWQQR